MRQIPVVEVRHRYRKMARKVLRFARLHDMIGVHCTAEHVYCKVRCRPINGCDHMSITVYFKPHFGYTFIVLMIDSSIDGYEYQQVQFRWELVIPSIVAERYSIKSILRRILYTVY